MHVHFRLTAKFHSRDKIKSREWYGMVLNYLKDSPKNGTWFNIQTDIAKSDFTTNSIG